MTLAQMKSNLSAYKKHTCPRAPKTKNEAIEQMSRFGISTITTDNRIKSKIRFSRERDGMTRNDMLNGIADAIHTPVAHVRRQLAKHSLKHVHHLWNNAMK